MGMSDRRTLRAEATALLVVFLTVVTDVSARADRALIGCRIDVAVDGEALRIEAVAFSLENMRGSYRFALQKASADGRSQNMQSGDFDLQTGQEKILSTTYLRASDADHFQAKLVLNSNSGSVSCISP
jgi:hypothetical protein